MAQSRYAGACHHRKGDERDLPQIDMQEAAKAGDAVARGGDGFEADREPIDGAIGEKRADIAHAAGAERQFKESGESAENS